MHLFLSALIPVNKNITFFGTKTELKLANCKKIDRETVFLNIRIYLD